MRRLLIDCDPGIDDALAILLALSEKSFDIKAITTESGNVDVRQTTRNLVSILQLSRMKRFPKIGKGSSRPLAGKIVHARLVHGKDGLGEYKFSLPKSGINIEDGIELIISETVSKDIDAIIATGPLTNLAKALIKKPEISRFLKKIYIMGGALRVPGNVSEHAEFNFFCDPHAAKIVLESKIPLVLVSLDVTQKAILRKSDLIRFKGIKTDLSDFIRHIANYSIDYHTKYRFSDGAFIHDPLAAALAIDEGMAVFEELSIGIEVEGEKRGRIFIREGAPNVRFCKDVDYERFLSLLLERLEILSKLGGGKLNPVRPF